MRRRRRQPTQIIKKKANTPTSGTPYYVAAGGSGKSRKLLYAVLTLAILATISYFVYRMAGPADDLAPVQTEINQSAETESEPVAEEQQPAPFEHRIQVEILNGCGVNGIAKIFQSHLRDEGFDVVNTENYSVNGKLNWSVEKTFIIDHIGVLEQSKSVARALGVSTDNIQSQQTQQPLYDVSVVIGKDYKSLLPQ